MTSFLFSAADAVKATEKDLKKAMKSYGFHTEGYKKSIIAGEQAEGVCYEYEAQGIAMYAESYVVKHGKFFYYLHYYSRKTFMDDNAVVWSDIMDSVSEAILKEETKA